MKNPPRSLCALVTMRLLRLFLVLVGFVAALLAREAQSFADVLAGWDVSKLTQSDAFGPSPMAPTESNANVTVIGLTRGTGVTTSGTPASRAWGGTGWDKADKAAAISGNRYATFSVTAKSGYLMSLSSLSRFDYRRSAKGPSSGVLQYQVGSGGSFVDIATLSYSVSDSGGASLPATDLSGFADLQNVPAGTTVTFRIVNYKATDPGGTWYVFDYAKSTANDLAISGTVTPPPSGRTVLPETAANGTGALIGPSTLNPSASLMAYAISRDANGAFIANVAATWSLVSITGGIVGSDLVAASDGKSAVFTAHGAGQAALRTVVAGLSSTDSGLITVVLPATTVRPESASDGSGVPIPASTLAPGSSLTAYAVSRDGNGAFVGNVAATWSLAGITGGVVSGDLVPSADAKSATFTAHAAGSGALRAMVAGLSSTDSGTITVPQYSVQPETVADGTGTLVNAQELVIGHSITAFAITRDAQGHFLGNASATWSLASITGGVVDSDLVVSSDGRSAVFTAHAVGTGAIRAAVSGFTQIDSGLITVTSAPTDPSVTLARSVARAANGQSITLTATVLPGRYPTSTGLTVVGDLSAMGGLPGSVFHDDGQNGDAVAGDSIYSFKTTIPDALSFGDAQVSATVSDAQGRSGSSSVSVHVLGPVSILHMNDTHARLTPHDWIVPTHEPMSSNFEKVGGAAYLGSAVLQLAAATPSALVIDAGDISEGNPVGDMNGNGAMTQFYELLSQKLTTQRGRGMDAVVVGNHDVRDAVYIFNLEQLRDSGVPVLSMNVRDVATHQPHFAEYTIVEVNGTKVGILGYTTQAAEVGASLAGTLEVADCDWWSSDGSKIHIADRVAYLRNTLGCDMVVLAAHIGHSPLATTAKVDNADTQLLADDGRVKLPEVAVTGHWHTWTDTVWQPESLNYKTIFTESSSYMKYVGELKVSGAGKYLSSQQHIVRVADFTPPEHAAPDQDLTDFVQGLVNAYNEAHPSMPLETVVGYTNDNLMLDNSMRWWSADEYPWSGNNTAGQWICDAMQWKASQLFAGGCDLAIETGGGVRADVQAGPVTYRQVYETFPWNDDTFVRVNMTGKDIVNFLKETNCDAGFSRQLEVTASDGVPTNVKFNGAPIDPNHVYTVAINNYMYAHPPNGYTWPDSAPLTSPVLCREGIVDYMKAVHPDQAHAYSVGGQRYHLNTEFSGGYRAVVTMMNDNDTKNTYEDAFIRLLSATSETLARRGSNQVPASLVAEDGSIVASNRLAEEEMYRSYLGFRRGMLRPGDILETWGKGSFYQGNPEFVDQEGIVADGVELRVIGHDPSLAKPSFKRYIGQFWNDDGKNHYVSFLAKVSGAHNVIDQYGQSIALDNATGYSYVTGLPSNGTLVLVTGVTTMENFGLRFRTDKIELASTYGITSFLPESTVASQMESAPSLTTADHVVLSATAGMGGSGGARSFAPIADAQVSSVNASSNYGSTTWLYVQSATSGFGNERSWLKFDLSTLPADATVTSAVLKGWCWRAAGPALAVEVRGGTSDSWTEAGITWNNQPTFGNVITTQTLAARATDLSYSWDVTSFVQQQLAGDKVVSLVLKPQTEDSTASPAPSYAFEAKEWGSNAVALEVTVGSSAPTVANVSYYARYSTDNQNWGSWSLAGTVPTSSDSSYATTYNFSNGTGYYEFYSAASDGAGSTEAAPPVAQTAVHHVLIPDPPVQSIVTLSALSQSYDGSPRSVTATTVPASLATSVTYNGSATPPIHPGSYQVVGTVTQPGYFGDKTETLVVSRGLQTVAITVPGSIKSGAAPFTLSASASSGLPVVLTSSDPSVATISGNVVTVVGAGTTTITGTQNGDLDWAPATGRADLVVSGGDSAQVPASSSKVLGALAGLLALAGFASLRTRRSAAA